MSDALIRSIDWLLAEFAGTVSGVLLVCFPIIKWLVTFLTLLICHLPVSLYGPNVITDHREVVEEISILWLGKHIHFIWRWQALFLLQGQDEYCGLKWASILSIPQSHPSKQGLELAWQRNGSCFFAWYSIFCQRKIETHSTNNLSGRQKEMCVQGSWFQAVNTFSSSLVWIQIIGLTHIYGFFSQRLTQSKHLTSQIFVLYKTMLLWGKKLNPLLSRQETETHKTWDLPKALLKIWSSPVSRTEGSGILGHGWGWFICDSQWNFAESRPWLWASVTESRIGGLQSNVDNHLQAPTDQSLYISLQLGFSNHWCWEGHSQVYSIFRSHMDTVLP